MNSTHSVCKVVTLLFLGVTPLLAGCSSAEERRQAAKDLFKGIEQTASGTVKGIEGHIDSFMDTGKSVTEGVTEMVEDAQKRINQVQSGVNLLLQGKEMIESGVSGEESQ